MVRYMKKVLQVTAGTTAQDVSIQNAPFLIANNSANTVYIKDKQGVAATTSNAFGIPPGVMLQHQLTCETLSIIASGAGSAVSILFTDLG